MKLLLLLTTLFLSASPALANENYKGGLFEGENYVMTFYRIRNSVHIYSVSVIEPRSVKNDKGVVVPSSFSFNCENGNADGFVAMGADRSKAFIEDVMMYYLLEFCTRNGINTKSGELMKLTRRHSSRGAFFMSDPGFVLPWWKQNTH